MAAFNTREYRDRVSAVSAEMEKRNIDTLVVFSEANLCYLTGYEGFSDYVPQAAILRAGDTDPILLLREMDIHCAYPTAYLTDDKIECYSEDHIGTSARSPWDAIGDRVLKIAHGGCIGVEFGANCFSFDDYRKLTSVLDATTLVDGSGVVECAKRVKSDSEISYMRDAGRIVDKALLAGVEQISEGVRECDVAATILKHLTKGTHSCGGGPTKPVTMGVGSRAAAPHLKWTDEPYKMGSQTGFEIGGYVHRYCCPLSRTAYLGDPPDRLRYLHDSVLESFLAAYSVVRPGNTCGDVYRAFATTFFTKGIRKESRIGYSLGIDWSDGCFSLQGDDSHILEVNNTFHLIIGVWEKDDAYVFSEALHVVENGVESFSNAPRELFVCN